MSTDITLAGFDPNQVPALADMFGGQERNDDLSQGVSASFPVLSFKGKVWRVKHKGEEKTVLNNDGDPVASLTAVLMKASPNISKLYYEKQYAEGDDAAPTCFSLDGIKPDPASEKKQSETCAVCPHNVWGSRVTDNGNKTKACADNRRIAVAPYPDIDNAGDGPMLLRVPPASLASLVSFKEKLDELKLPYQAVVVKIGFDTNLAYPKLVFTPVRALTLEEAEKVKGYMESEQVNNMFTEVVDEGDKASQKAAESTSAAADPKPSDEPKASPAPSTTTPEPQPEPQPEPKPETPKQTAADEGQVADEGDEDLNARLASILGD